MEYSSQGRHRFSSMLRFGRTNAMMRKSPIKRAEYCDSLAKPLSPWRMTNCKRVKTRMLFPRWRLGINLGMCSLPAQTDGYVWKDKERFPYKDFGPCCFAQRACQTFEMTKGQIENEVKKSRTFIDINTFVSKIMWGRYSVCSVSSMIGMYAVTYNPELYSTRWL